MAATSEARMKFNSFSSHEIFLSYFQVLDSVVRCFIVDGLNPMSLLKIALFVDYPDF